MDKNKRNSPKRSLEKRITKEKAESPQRAINMEESIVPIDYKPSFGSELTIRTQKSQKSKQKSTFIFQKNFLNQIYLQFICLNV